MHTHNMLDLDSLQDVWDYINKKVRSPWSTREQAENLQLVLVFVGESNGECWWCFDRNSSTGDCLGDEGRILDNWICMYLRFGAFGDYLMKPDEIDDLLANAPEYEAPSFAVLDILASDPRHMAVTIDGSESICIGEVGSMPPIASLFVPYMGKVRLVVSPSLAPDRFRGSSLNIEIVRTKHCRLNQTGDLKVPLKLVPGPSVHFMFNISKDLDSVRADKFKNRFCNLLWPETYYADRQERCSFQLFLQTVELQVTMTVLMQSNGHATRARLLINEEFRKSEFRAEYGVVWSATSASVHAPSTFGLGKSQTWGAKAKLDMSSNHGCFSHEDCEDGMFCSNNPVRNQTFVGWFGCDPCWYCYRDIDAVDGKCPRDRCGDLAGSYPLCLDAVPFLRGFECKSKFQLNMSIVRDDETIPSDLSNQSSSSGTEMKEKTKARFLTPFNRLVGAIMITQERSSTTVTCTVQNQYIQNFSNSGRGTVCRTDTLDSSPFGVDPAFSISSALYAGDLAPEDFYAKTERSQGKDGSPGAPYGFFPENYAGRNLKNGSLREVTAPQSASNVTALDSSGNRFKLYFDERIKSAHAQKLLTYMIDGSFLDDRTRKVTVEMNTLNVQMNMMATFEFIFEFQV